MVRFYIHIKSIKNSVCEIVTKSQNIHKKETRYDFLLKCAFLLFLFDLLIKFFVACKLFSKTYFFQILREMSHKDWILSIESMALQC